MQGMVFQIVLEIYIWPSAHSFLLFILLLIFKGLVRSCFIGKSFHLWVSSLSDHIVSKIYSHMTENMIPGGQELLFTVRVKKLGTC